MSVTYKVEMVRCKVVRDRMITLPRRDIVSLDDSLAIMHKLTDDSPSEKFVVMHVNAKNSILGVEVVAQGGVSGACLRAVEVVRSAIIRNASAIIVGHNHPSGDSTPSQEDIEMTHMLVGACKMIGIPLLDHVIVTARGGHCSLLERGIVR
jgi:DNA repair protein RadC